MIPEFTELGLLPPGIHSATWHEFSERFVVFQHSDQRIQIGDRLKALYDECKNSEIVRRFLVAGSYVTDKAEPNDYDCLLVFDPAIVKTLLAPHQYNLISHRMAKRRFKGDIMTVIDGSAVFLRYLEFFQTTRDGEKTGIVEILL